MAFLASLGTPAGKEAAELLAKAVPLDAALAAASEADKPEIEVSLDHLNYQMATLAASIINATDLSRDLSESIPRANGTDLERVLGHDK